MNIHILHSLFIFVQIPLTFLVLIWRWYEANGKFSYKIWLILSPKHMATLKPQGKISKLLFYFYMFLAAVLALVVTIT